MMANTAGLVFQISVMGGAFAVAGLMLLVGLLIRKRSFLESSPPPLPLHLVGDQSNPYTYRGVVEGAVPPPQGGSEEKSAMNRVGCSWVSRTDLIGLTGICSFFAFLCFGNLAVSEQVEVKSINVEGVLTHILIFVFLLVITGALVYRRVKPGAWLGLRWSRWALIFVSPLVVVAMWILLGLLTACGYVSWMERMCGSPSTQEAVKMLREGQDVFAVALMAFAAVVAAPVVEETVFRGYLYPVVKRWLGAVPAMLFTSLVFAAGHGNATLLLPLFVLGVILVLAYEFTGSIWMPIAIHACFNGATVLVQLLARYGVVDLPTAVP